MRRLLHAAEYSLQGNRKTREGAAHPDRNAQEEDEELTNIFRRAPWRPADRRRGSTTGAIGQASRMATDAAARGTSRGSTPGRDRGGKSDRRRTAAQSGGRALENFAESTDSWNGALFTVNRLEAEAMPGEASPTAFRTVGAKTDRHDGGVDRIIDPADLPNLHRERAIRTRV